MSKKKVRYTIYIDEELLKKIKELAIKKYGIGRGSISLAFEDAVRDWIDKNTKDDEG